MKKKYYLVLDTETATLPFASQLAQTDKDKQTIAIAKPLVYDIGWVIVDRQGNTIKESNYLVQETFFVPNVFNTAYYSAKRPIYMQMLANNEITVKSWNDIMNELIADLQTVDLILAYNACFDYKKAIPFTERYIYHLYNADYNQWEQGQKAHCVSLLNGASDDSKNPNYLLPHLTLRGVDYPIADLWTIACDRLINIDKYRNYCLDNNLLTNSKLYFKSSAETSFQYLMKDYNFTEDHTALSDAKIEAKILLKALAKGKVIPTVEAFPFKNLGTTYDYVLTKKPKYQAQLKQELEDYLTTLNPSAYYSRIENIINSL